MQRCAVLSPFYYAKKIKTMAENDYKINIALGTSFDPAGLEQAQQQLEKLKPADATATQAATEAERELTKAREESAEAAQQAAEAGLQVKELLTTEAQEVEELVEVKAQNAAADAKEQKAMKLATKSRDELIKTLKQLQKELKAAAEAQDVEKYRAVEQEIAETRSAFEKQNQVLELNNIQLGQQAQNGMMVANTLTGMANGLKDGSMSAGDFASGILSISAAMKAGLGPIGWLMMAVQGLQAAWDYFAAEDKKEEEVRAKRAEDMQRLAEITDNARKALEDYNRTELSKKALAAVQGYYTNINTQLERQIKNIERATQAELARLALTQDADEHKRTMKRAKLGRQLAAGTITQEQYDSAIYDMNEQATKQGLDADVAEAERQEKELTDKANVAWDAYHETQEKHFTIAGQRLKYGELTVKRLELMKGEFDTLTDAQNKAIEERDALINEDADEEQIAAANDKLHAIMAKRSAAAEKIWQAYDRVHGKGAHRSSDSGSTADMITGMIADRSDVDEQFTSSKTERDKLWETASGLVEQRDAARTNVKNARDKRTQELGQLAEERAEEEKGRALQKLLDEKKKAETELAKMETAELKRRQKDAQKRAKAARDSGDEEGAAVLEKLAIIYKDEVAQRSKAAKAKSAVDAARKKTEDAAPTQDKRTDEVLREAEQLANRIAKGEALDGRRAEQLLALFEQAKATKDKKDDAFVAQLIHIMQMQADMGASLQGDVRKLKRETEKLKSRNFD